ncbi:intraflagellar transport protein 81 homolog [Halichondria panicea]|uniref:intraflagellar transport protein 81 homolog n=1 Tax=Halichondria panicea TaxID=6063 RepID=UPI00312B7E18
MTEQLRLIVDTLNQPPFSKQFNLVTFDSLNSLNLLQVLNDVLAEISPDHQMDLRQEPPEQTAVRILSLLHVLRYKPKSDQGGGLNAFRHGLLLGNKPTIYPLLQWLLEKLPELKKRAYLARYLVKIELLPEMLQDDIVAEANANHEELVEQFKELHHTIEQQKASQFSVADIKKDIASMEEEKEQLIKRTERLKAKAETLPNKAEMLEAAMKLRREKDREITLTEQKLEQKNSFLHAQEKVSRLQKQLEDMKSSSDGLSAEGLISKLQEENHLKQMLVSETLPKKVEAKRKECIELEQVLAEPVLNDLDLDTIRQQIDECTEEVARLMEKRLPGSDPVQDKLALFRQQASIIARKKEAAAESYKSVMDELAALESELQSKREQLNKFDGGEILREEEFKRYLARLRVSNNTYKKKKSELGALKAEYGVLARTEEILRSRDENVEELVKILEEKKGVRGYKQTQDALEEVSVAKNELDEQKSEILTAMTSQIEQLTAAIETKKAFLSPLIKEIRPLRQNHQELLAQHAEKKVAYDGVAAGLEGQRADLEREVRAYWEETMAEESRYHYLQCMIKSIKLQQERVAAEMRCYVSSDPAEKRKSRRDLFTRKIQEQENLGKGLRDQQKEIQETHSDALRQVKMWQDLRRQFKVKKQCFVSDQQRRMRDKAEEKMAATENRLVIT